MSRSKTKEDLTFLRFQASNGTLRSMLIVDIPVALKARNMLIKNGFRIVDQLIGMKAVDFLELTGCGVVSAQQLESFTYVVEELLKNGEKKRFRAPTK